MATAFGLTIPDDLPGLEDDIRDALDDAGDDVADVADDVRSSDAFDGSAFDDLLERSGLDDLNGNANIGNLNDIAALAEALPGGLGDPDSTGEVPTGASSFAREQVAVAASLAAAPRIVEALGPGAQFVDVRGESFLIADRYVDAVSGFSAIRLTSLDGGTEVFAIDGLEVGSRADETAAATLGRLQIESDAFREMVADASLVTQTTYKPVQFVGPSLGGAVAQAAAYETAETFAGFGWGPGAVELVTVDPLGGRDATEAVNGGTLNPAALGLINALNVRTDGDVVSRISSHIGSTLTLPALDANGNVVQLDAADAHVNVVSLLQTLSSDALFANGVRGQPAEISGFAAAATASDEAVIAAWRASGEQDDGVPGELQVPGNASFDAAGTTYSLDADANGTVDLAVRLSAPVSAATADLVLVG